MATARARVVREAASIQYGERGRAALPARRRKARRYLAQNLTKCAERSGDLDFDVLFGEPDRVVVPVDVIVHDRDGQPVADLTAADFKLFEDGKEQKVEFFQVNVARATGAGRPALSATATPPLAV